MGNSNADGRLRRLLLGAFLVDVARVE